MANTINYASKYSRKLLEAITQGALVAPLITSAVDWLDAKNFHFTGMQVSGFKDASTRSLGWNIGEITQTDHVYTLEHERNILLPVHKADVDESNLTATIANIAARFTQTQHIPEVDAYTFSKIASFAKQIQQAGTDNDGTVFETAALNTWTTANAYTKIVQAIGKAKLKLYRADGRGVEGWVRTEIMDLLALSTELQHRMNVERNMLTGVETRVVNVNGVRLHEVVNTERFKTAYDFTDGFTADDDAGEINVLFCAPAKVKVVPKINDIYFYEPGSDTNLGNNYGYAEYALMDAFMFRNDATNKYDSFYVEATA